MHRHQFIIIITNDNNNNDDDNDTKRTHEKETLKTDFKPLHITSLTHLSRAVASARPLSLPFLPNKHSKHCFELAAVKETSKRLQPTLSSTNRNPSLTAICC